MMNVMVMQDANPPSRSDDKNFKVDVKIFDSGLDPEKCQEWDQSPERYFEYKDIND